jgi:Raf kinase inhibitor-like YbhB/YbcL family protein
VVRRLALLLLATAVACGSSGDTGRKADTTTPPATGPAARIALTSTAFADGGAIPRQYTCDGAGQSPPLAWGGVPAGASALALRVQDIDTPQKFTHWLLFNIDPKTTSLAPGQVPAGATQAKNSFGNAAYGGPCPPKGAGAHRYVFTLLAMEPQQVTVSDEVSPAELWSTLERSSVLAKGVLTGTYQRAG